MAMSVDERILAFRQEYIELCNQFGVEIVSRNQITYSENAILIEKVPTIKIVPIEGWVQPSKEEEIEESNGITQPESG